MTRLSIGDFRPPHGRHSTKQRLMSCPAGRTFRQAAPSSREDLLSLTPPVVGHLLTLLLGLCFAASAQAQPVPGFGPPDNKKPIVGFGLQAEIMLDIEAAHWEHTIGYMKRADKNRSGFLERDEVEHFSDRQFRESDIDGDGRLNFYEKALEDLDARQQGQVGRRKRTETRIIDGIAVDPAHRQSAIDTMKKYDKNQNGVIDANEVSEDWRTRDLSLTDRNGDGRVTLRELERRWAEHRMESAARNKWWRELALDKRAASDRTWELAAAIIKRHDRDKNNALSSNEWRNVPSDISSADTNGNGYIVVMEFSDWMLKHIESQPATVKLNVSVPEWFVERDVNFDGQVLLSEYTTSLKPSIIAEFRKFDRNGDGVITTKESQQPVTDKERFTNDREIVLEPRLGGSSEIVIPHDITIADIDVQFFMRHRDPEEYRGILTSPSGHKVELFNGKGKRWRGSNFVDTVLDDEAATSITQANPPFNKTYQPEGVGQRKSSLSAFYGKPARGTWRFDLVTTTANLPGILHGWSLIIKPRRR